MSTEDTDQWAEKPKGYDKRRLRERAKRMKNTPIADYLRKMNLPRPCTCDDCVRLANEVEENLPPLVGGSR
jgi:hypothetical protein